MERSWIKESYTTSFTWERNTGLQVKDLFCLPIHPPQLPPNMYYFVLYSILHHLTSCFALVIISTATRGWGTLKRNKVAVSICTNDAYDCSPNAKICKIFFVKMWQETKHFVSFRMLV